VSNPSPDSLKSAPADVTLLLQAAARGEPQAAGQLLPLVYGQLRALAQQYMLAERSNHTLQATALVHEAYIRLVQGDQIDWNGRSHFYLTAGEAMRRILVDHARKTGATKRGGQVKAVSLNLVDLADGEGLGELLAIDELLQQLAQSEPQAAKVVNLRFFAGLSVDDTARALNISPRTVGREWQYARAWLKMRLTEASEEPANG
jgi:RNA polymerase sigma-70 factor, ECF subfamily